MKTRITLLLAIVIVLLPVLSSAATVVVNNEVDPSKINADELEMIYLGKKTLWDSGQRIVPVLVNEESEESKQFLERVLSKSVSQYRAYWKRRLFSGGGTVPKTFRNSAEVVDYVSKTPGAIGIVQPGTKDSRLKIVEIGK